MNVRTLWNWEHQRSSARPPGRPRDERSRELARVLVRAELERQGWTSGEGPIYKALKPRLKLHVLREILAELKAERRSHDRRVRARGRLSVVVHARDALWSIDQTHLGRTVDGRAIQSEVLRDVASALTIDLTIGTSVRAVDIIAMLERARIQRGTLPLGLAADPGSENENQELERYLARHQVVRLRSFPRTPQHNPWAEHTIGELKKESGLGKGVLLRDHEDARARLEPARERLDQARLRRSRGWKTAAQVDLELPSAPLVVDRQTFYAATRAAQQRAMLDASDDLERRRAERRSTLAMLVCFDLITMTRGGASLHAPKAEMVL